MSKEKETKMQALHQNTRYSQRRLIRLKNKDFKEPDLSLEEKKECWHNILHGLPLDVVVLERNSERDERIIGGTEVLCALHCLTKGVGHINLDTLEYNEDENGLPLAKVFDPEGFFKWYRKSWAEDEEMQNTVVSIQGFILDVFVPTAIIKV